MADLAFMFDGRWLSHPPHPITASVVFAPLATVACWLLVRKDRRFVSYAIGIAGFSAMLQVLPLYRVLLNTYDLPYRPAEMRLLFTVVGLPFVVTALAYAWYAQSWNGKAAPTRSNLGSPREPEASYEATMKFAGFYPELFEQKAIALERLEAAGFVWLQDFTAIDLLHEDYGIEVCGIKEERAANRIARLLAAQFREWHYGGISYHDRERDCGWRVQIFKWRRDSGDSEAAR